MTTSVNKNCTENPVVIIMFHAILVAVLLRGSADPFESGE